MIWKRSKSTEEIERSQQFSCKRKVCGSQKPKIGKGGKNWRELEVVYVRLSRLLRDRKIYFLVLFG